MGPLTRDADLLLPQHPPPARVQQRAAGTPEGTAYLLQQNTGNQFMLKISLPTENTLHFRKAYTSSVFQGEEKKRTRQTHLPIYELLLKLKKKKTAKNCFDKAAFSSLNQPQTIPHRACSTAAERRKAKSEGGNFTAAQCSQAGLLQPGVNILLALTSLQVTQSALELYPSDRSKLGNNRRRYIN